MSPELSIEQKRRIYQSFKEREQYLEGYPYLRLPNQSAFFEEGNPLEKPSLLKKIYYSFWN